MQPCNKLEKRRQTNISPNEAEDEDGDDDQNDLDEFERKSVTGVKICTMKSCMKSCFIKGWHMFLKCLKAGKLFKNIYFMHF